MPALLLLMLLLLSLLLLPLLLPGAVVGLSFSPAGCCGALPGPSWVLL